MIPVLFWGAIACVLYTYAVFPAVVLLRGALRPRPVRSQTIVPRVSVIIAARNEAGTIGTKVENLLGLDYDQSLLEIVIVSDGSTDGTERVAADHGEERVTVLCPGRVGKAAALNAGVAAAHGEILVFSDANSMFAPDAMTALVRPFADPDIGGVAGDQRYLDAGDTPGDTDGLVTGERDYWAFDRVMKVFQSRGGNVISATGAIYALRAELFEPVIDGVTDDFFASTGVIVRGKRLVFASDAVAYEPVAPTGTQEFARKVRVITRGLRAVFARRELLNVRRHGFYAVQLVSHKVLRRLMVVPLSVAAVSSFALASRGGPYLAVAAGQAVFYVLAAVGFTRVTRAKIVALPAYFCMTNAAAARALWNVCRGTRIDRWEPARPMAQ